MENRFYKKFAIPSQGDASIIIFHQYPFYTVVYMGKSHYFCSK